VIEVLFLSKTITYLPHVEDLDYPLMAEDLKEFMEQHWIPKAHIIGHSMGGKTAMQFALDYPDMLDKLVVVVIVFL